MGSNSVWVLRKKKDARTTVMFDCRLLYFRKKKLDKHNDMGVVSC